MSGRSTYSSSTCTCARAPHSHVPPFPSARKLLAGARRRLLGELAPGRRDARRLLSARDRSDILTAERNGQWPMGSGAVVRENRGAWTEVMAGARRIEQTT